MWRHKTFPKIRLQGKWLEQLGFKPNGRVRIVPTIEGELLLKFIDEEAGTSSQLNDEPEAGAVRERLPSIALMPLSSGVERTTAHSQRLQRSRMSREKKSPHDRQRQSGAGGLTAGEITF